MKGPSLDLALRTLREDYFNDVRGVVSDFLGEMKGYGTDGWAREEALEWLSEALDGHARVIYTQQAQLGLAVSHNDSAGVESGLVTLGDEGVPWSALMFAAMEQDVIEELRRKKVDINEDPIYHPDFEGEEEEEDDGDIHDDLD